MKCRPRSRRNGLTGLVVGLLGLLFVLLAFIAGAQVLRNLPSLPSDGEVFGLDPGRGVYVPSFMPHWVQNGPRASVSLSITFRSRESLRADRVHRINSMMRRRLHMHPVPWGVSPARDRAKEAVWVAMRTSKQRLTTLRPARGARSAGPATH